MPDEDSEQTEKEEIVQLQQQPMPFPTMQRLVQRNLGRALLADTHTLLFMRFIGNDGRDNLLWSISFDTEISREKFGDLPSASASPSESAAYNEGNSVS